MNECVPAGVPRYLIQKLLNIEYDFVQLVFFLNVDYAKIVLQKPLTGCDKQIYVNEGCGKKIFNLSKNVERRKVGKHI